MQKSIGISVTLMFATLVSACATRPPAPEAAASEFIIERDLVGQSVARGEFRSITGVRRGFTAQLNGTWNGRTLTLVEDFEFDDGERDRKTWRLERVAPGRYVGAREDVVGEAVGYQDGPVFRLEYDMLLPSDNGRGRKVRFRDVMAASRDGSIINDATVGWFGFRVGSVSLVIERLPPQPEVREPAGIMAGSN
jgi:hypothetical protein